MLLHGLELLLRDGAVAIRIDPRKALGDAVLVGLQLRKAEVISSALRMPSPFVSASVNRAVAAACISAMVMSPLPSASSVSKLARGPWWPPLAKLTVGVI